MERLTTDKDASEMNMLELAHNSCYVKDGFARYRDFENDYDSRDLARFLIKKYTGEDAPTDDEEFDEYIIDDLQYSMFSTSGFIALFYRNLWAMAELREKLKEYEDAEENGLLVRLPCKLGDKIYYLAGKFILEFEVVEYNVSEDGVWLIYARFDDGNVDIYKRNFVTNDIGKTAFLNKAEAEAKLAKMEG